MRRVRPERLLRRVCQVEFTVGGVIVLVGVRSLTIREEPPDVGVVSLRTLRGWLSSQPASLEERSVEAVFDAARRAETWAGSRRA